MSREQNKKVLGWIAVGAGAVAAVALTRELAGSKERRARLSNHVHHGVDRVREAKEEVLQEGKEHMSSLQADARSWRAAVASSIHPGTVSGKEKESMSHGESAIAAFMASVLVKGVSGYIQWRAAEKSRLHGAGSGRSTPAGGRDAADMTVVELRKEASSQNIDGRSSMNKQELVSALED